MDKGTKFLPGDIVRLKSGGPPMTVDSWDTRNIQYFCTWFDGKKLESQRFNEESLEKVKSGEGPNIIGSGSGGVFIG